MEANARKLLDEFIPEAIGRQFVIPVYQRKYTWASTVSNAANILLGGRISGWDCWKDKNGKEIQYSLRSKNKER